MTPDVLIIGDSHTEAVLAGCTALGYNPIDIRFSGRNWHEGNIGPHKDVGLWMHRPWGRKKLAQIREQLGVENLARTELPVVMSVGYHLGRMVPPFLWNGHRVLEDGGAADAEAAVVSSGFVDDYITHYRAPHFELIRSFAEHGEVTVVPPPEAFKRPGYATFRSRISERIRATGARVYDSSDDLLNADGVIPADLLMDDGIHGNPEYGRRMVQSMIAGGFLSPPTQTATAAQ